MGEDDESRPGGDSLDAFAWRSDDGARTGAGRRVRLRLSAQSGRSLLAVVVLYLVGLAALTALAGVLLYLAYRLVLTIWQAITPFAGL